MSLRFICGALCLAALYLLTACGSNATPVALSNSAPTSVPTRALPTNAPATLPAQNTQAPATAPALAPTEMSAPSNPTPLLPPTEMPAPTQNAARVPSAYFGANTNGEVITNDQIRALAILGGVQMVRTSVTWKQVEGTAGKYNWSWPDKGFKTLSDNHLEPYVLILENADWAATTKCGPVQDLLAYDKFLRALAARYPNVKYWGLYNEPDNAHGVETSSGGCFGGDDIDGNGKPDYQDYATQLQIAWRAIHEANPQAKLVMGAVAFDNFDEASAPQGYPGGGKGGIFNARFLDQLFAYMQANPPPPGEKYFDALAFNFYGIYGPYWETQTQGKGITAKANVLNALLQKYGLEADLMVSETGEDSTLSGNQAQSAYVTETFVRGLSSRIAHMNWWTFQDFSDSAPPPTNTWKYGLIDQNAAPKPAYAAYQTASKFLRDAEFMQPLQVDGGEGYLFNNAGAGIAIVWSLSDAPVSLSFSANTLQLTDMFGVTRTVSDGSADDKDSAPGRIAISIDQNPVYVQAIQ